MNYKKIVPFILLTITLCSVWFLQVSSVSSGSQRTVASVDKSSCSSLLRPFLKKKEKRSTLNAITHFTTAPIESTIYGLKKASYTLRFRILRMTGFLSISSLKLSHRYKDLVNIALDQDIIDPNEARALAERFKESKRIKLIFDEQTNRLVIDESNLVIDSQKLNTFFRSFKIRNKEIQNEVKANYLTKQELEAMTDPRNGVNEQNIGDVMTYIHTCRSFKIKKQSICLDSLRDIFDRSATSQYQRRYIKIKKASDNYTKRATNKVLKELRKDDPSLTSESIPSLKRIEIRDQVRAFKSLRLACQSQVKTTARTTARNRLLTAVIAGETISAASMYTLENKEKVKDEDWMSDLGESVAINIVSGFIHANIASSAAGFVKKSAAEYLISATKDINTSMIYSKHLAPSPERLKKEVEKLLKDPNFYAQLESMLTTAEDEQIYKKVEEELSRYHQFGQEELSVDQKEESLNSLAEILAYQAYIAFSNGHIQLGDIGHDYFAFNRIWDMGASASNIGFTLFIYSAMCRAESTMPKAQVIAGATAYVISEIASQNFYNTARKYTLGF